MTLQRWNKLTEWPLTIIAVIFLVTYSWEVIGNLRGQLFFDSEVIIWITWASFLVDYIVSLSLAPDRKRWFVTHLVDLAVVVLPMLRPLRLLRVFTLIGVLNRTIGAAFRGKVIIYVAGSALLLVYVAALAMLEAERGQGNIQNLWQAVWWAFTYVTTVGSPFYPVTVEGQLIAMVVMVGGLALIGAVTATMASWIVERVGQEEVEKEHITQAHVDEILAEVRSLRFEVERMRQPQAEKPISGP